MQETTFPVEVIIHDDASTDGTAGVIRKYQDKYPHLLKPIFQAINQYSEGGAPGQRTRETAAGKYIAICEGDDYWTDPQKLQIQVDFLENNPKYVVSGHDASIIDETGKLVSKSKMPQSQMRDRSGEELVLGRAWLLTLTMVYRNVIGKHPVEMRSVKNGDVFLLSLLGQYGMSKYHSEIKPAVYRRHPGGTWSQLSTEERRDSHINTYFWLYRYYRRTQVPAAADHYWRLMSGLVCKDFSVRQVAALFARTLVRRVPILTWLERLGARLIHKAGEAVGLARLRS